MWTTIGLLVLLMFVASMGYAAHRGAPWVPTWKRDLKRIHALVDLQPGERFVELGCGNGRVCRYIARTTDAGEVVGVELSLLQWLVAKVQGGARFELADVFYYDLSGYDAVYMFLMPETYEKIRPKLEQELKPGARVVTYVWPIEGWEPELVNTHEGAPNLYLYEKKS